MSSTAPDTQASIPTEVTSFGTMPDGTNVDLFTVWSGRSEATFTSFGARLVSLKVPDARGRVEGVVLGYDSLSPYLADKAYFGAIAGRVANRIAGGTFPLDGQTIQVPINNGPNALHGGPNAFDQHIWTGTPIDNGVEFTLVSPAGENGFPGTLTLTVRYTFTAGVLTIDYEATTDALTVINVTNHAYFNLAGDSSGSILNHELTIPADHFTPVDATLIPTGELRHVQATPFDFRQPILIGRRIDERNEQLGYTGGYDHNFVFGSPGVLKQTARVREQGSGRVLTVQTTEPGMQFYSGNFIDGSMPNRRGGLYLRRSGFCLETQHYPDSPNHPDFPSIELRPGDTFRSTTIYTFTAEG